VRVIEVKSESVERLKKAMKDVDNCVWEIREQLIKESGRGAMNNECFSAYLILIGVNNWTAYHRFVDKVRQVRSIDR